MFNDMFSNNFQHHFLGQQEAIITKNKIKNIENTFIFPFTVYAGFANITSNGIQPNNAKPQNYSQFSSIMTGKEGIVAIWDNSLKLHKNEYIKIDKNNINDWGEFKIQKRLINGISRLFDSDYNIFCIWNNEQQLFISENQEFKYTLNFIYKELKEGKNDYIEIDPNAKNEPYYKKEFQKGNYFKGRIDNTQKGVEFGQAPGSQFFGEYTQWQSIKKFTIDTTIMLDDEELYKLYMIPQAVKDNNKNDITLFYISNIDTYYDNKGKFIYHRILFASLNDSISSSGMSIWQFVQFASPGEGYAIPKLIYDNKNNIIDFEIDKDRILDRGIDTIQIEILGPAGFCAPIIYGRPIKELGKINNIYAPRLILTRDIKYPIADNLSRQSNPESTFYLTNAKPMILSYYKDWKEARRAEYTDEIQKNFDGWLETYANDTKSSNPEGLSIKDVNLTFNNKNVINLDYDVRTAGWFNYVKENGEQFGYDKINPSKNPRGRIFDMFNLFTFMFQWIRSLPIDNVQKISWSLNQIPVIGGFLNKITLGIPIGWRVVDNKSDITFPNFRGLPIFMSASLYNWYNDAFWGGNAAGQGNLPLDMFKNHTDDSVGGIVNAGAMSTTFIFRLSDKISATQWDINTKKEEKTVNVSTLMIGQNTTNLNKVWDYNFEKDKTFLINHNSLVIEPNLDNEYITDIKGINKYIIDSIGFIGIVKAPVRITMFGNDPDQSSNPYAEVIYQTTLQSYSMFTNNVRDNQTLFKLTYLDDFIEAEQGDFEFPRPLPEPNPNIDFDNINLDLSGYSKGYWNEFINKSSERIKDTKNWDLLIYDFEKKGLSNWDQVLTIYQNISINIDINIRLGNKVENYPNDDNSQIWEFNKKYNIDLFTILQSGLQIFNEYKEKIFDKSKKYTRQRHQISFYYEGTKLYLRFTNTYDIDARSNQLYPGGIWRFWYGTSSVDIKLNKCDIFTK